MCCTIVLHSQTAICSGFNFMSFVEVEPEQMAVCGYVRLASLSECIKGSSIAVVTLYLTTI